MAAVPSIGRATLVEAPGRASQAAATEGLYERHSARILGYCLHQLGSREEAEDAVQTTFMNAFRALGRGVVPEAEAAWLFKIAENVCLSRRRSSWRRGRIESPSDFEVIEEIVPGPSRHRDELIGIEDALAAMPEQQRRAILLREWQGLSYREIAGELEVSQSAVETLIFRARRSLAQGLEQPDSVKQPRRKGFRRALHALDVGTALAALKTLLAGSAAVKATAAAVVVTAAVGTAAGVAPKLEGKRHGPVEPATPDAVAPAPASERASAELAAVPSAPQKVAPTSPPAAVDAPAAVRKPQKIAEKATAKPPVRTRKAAPIAAAPAPVGHAQSRSEEPVRGQPAGRKPDANANGRAKASGKAKAPTAAPAPKRARAVAPVEAPAEPGAKAEENAGGKGSEKRRLAAAPEPEPAPGDVAAEPEAVAAPAAETVPAEQADGRRKDK